MNMRWYLNHCSTSILDSGQERAREPSVILDHILDWFLGISLKNVPVIGIRILSLRVVSPDDDIAHISDRDSSPGSDLSN